MADDDRRGPWLVFEARWLPREFGGRLELVHDPTWGVALGCDLHELAPPPGRPPAHRLDWAAVLDPDAPATDLPWRAVGAAHAGWLTLGLADGRRFLGAAILGDYRALDDAAGGLRVLGTFEIPSGALHVTP